VCLPPAWRQRRGNVTSFLPTFLISLQHRGSPGLAFCFLASDDSAMAFLEGMETSALVTQRAGENGILIPPNCFFGAGAGS